MKVWTRDVLLGLFVVLAVAAAIASYYFSVVARTSTTRINTDQTLASLSVNVAILTAVIALAAFGVAVLAIFGYAELRTATYRKTEDQLLQIIKQLQTSGELSAATATVLAQSVAPDRLFIPDKDSQSTPQASKDVGLIGTSQETKIAKQYPKENGNGDDGGKSHA